MKRFLCLLFVISFMVAIPTQAQFKFGVKAGVNLSGTPSDLDGISADGTTGFFVGPMAKFTIPLLGLGVEGDILYSRTGSEIGNEKIHKNSIEIPIYLRYDFSLPIINKVAAPFLAIGPQFGFAFGSTDEMTDWGKYEYKKSNVSLNLGLGAILLSHLQIHVNYNIALGKTSELSIIDVTKEAIDSKTNTWQISAAYLF